MGPLDEIDAVQQRIIDRQMEKSRFIHSVSNLSVVGPEGIPVVVTVRRGWLRGSWLCLATPQVQDGKRYRYKSRWGSEYEAAQNAALVAEDIRSGALVVGLPTG